MQFAIDLPPELGMKLIEWSTGQNATLGSLAERLSETLRQNPAWFWCNLTRPVSAFAYYEDGGFTWLEPAETFYREDLSAQPAIAAGLAVGHTLRTWDDLDWPERELFAQDLGSHVSWVFPEEGPLDYCPAPEVVAMIFETKETT